ncbi:MAG: O-antigen ligase family protein [Rhodospirillales bacterium]|nr:O-antigen ligase family protein [Rhodospirillales bacterium]
MTERAVPGSRSRPDTSICGAIAPTSSAERALLYTVHACLALVLLTPLVWAPETFHPFTVGKAVWSRSAIAVAFALWALLVMLNPRWRPPPSALLAALALGLAAATVSAIFGASPVRSLWSTYTRMEGLVDAAHWTAFALVLTAVLRDERGWDRMLNVHLGVGLVVALVAVARFHAPEAEPFGLPPEGRYPRISGTTANPTFLGAYLQATALIAAGFLVRSFCTAPAGGAPAEADTRSGRRRARDAPHRAPTPDRSSANPLWPARLFWLAAAAAATFALTLTGSMGALAGLGAGAVAAATLCAWFGRTRRARQLGLASLAALAAAAVLLAAVLAVRAVPGGTPAPAFDIILLERITSTERIGNTLGGRIHNWEAGTRAFAERPLLGWGPGNYFVASGRYRDVPEGRTRINDHAHNMTIETAATGGLGGLAAYALLWGLTAAAVLRQARSPDPRRRALAIFAGAALVGWFVQSQTLFYAHESWLQHMLLLAFLVHLDAAAFRTGKRGRTARAMLERALEALRRARRWAAVPVRATIAVAALALAGASLTANTAIIAANAAIWRAETQGPFLDEMERSMRAFDPLANGPRVILFNNAAANWPVVSERHPETARRLLDWTGEEAAAAIAAEPESWVVHHALARMYRAMAATHPEYAASAEHHFQRSLELAPNLDPLEAPVGSPVRQR